MQNTSNERTVPPSRGTPRRPARPQPSQGKLEGYVPDLLREFLRKEVRPGICPNCDLTANEILEVLGAYCERHGWRWPSIVLTRRYLSQIVMEVYGVAESHSVKRDGKNCRGYRGVEWRPCGDSEGTAPVPEEATVVPEVEC